MGLRHSAATILLNQVGRDLREIQADHRNLRSILTKFCKAGIGGGEILTAVKHKLLNQSLIALIATCAIALANIGARAAELAGNVQCAGEPIAGSTVTLFAAGTGAPRLLAQGKADDGGAFNLSYGQAPADSVLYVVAKGGTPKAAAGKGASEGLALLAVLGGISTVTVNELTTVASAFTAARFINGEAISGKSARTADRCREYAESGRSRRPAGGAR